jgi:hypothetical protein
MNAWRVIAASGRFERVACRSAQRASMLASERSELNLRVARPDRTSAFRPILRRNSGIWCALGFDCFLGETGPALRRWIGSSLSRTNACDFGLIGLVVTGFEQRDS